MPDISMCDNDSCTLKNTCYRYTAIPSKYRQAYMTGIEQDEDGKCEFYYKSK